MHSTQTQKPPSLRGWTQILNPVPIDTVLQALSLKSDMMGLAVVTLALCHGSIRAVFISCTAHWAPSRAQMPAPRDVHVQHTERGLAVGKCVGKFSPIMSVADGRQLGFRARDTTCGQFTDKEC